MVHELIPEVPRVPAAQRATGRSPLRHEDVTQDGRVALLALPQTLGVTLWQGLLAKDPVARRLASHGIFAILTRMAFAGGEGPVSAAASLEATGLFELAHTVDEHGAVNRLVLNAWAHATAPRGRTHGPPPAGAGEPIVVGRVHAEHVFTRPFAPPGARRVTSLAEAGVDPPVPPRRWTWRPPEDLLALPPGAEPLDPAPVADEAIVAFGLSHTDPNQHVNSLVYPRVFEDAALRRLASHGRATRLLPRRLEVAFRKPCFAGDRTRVLAQAFVLDGRAGCLGAFVPADEAASAGGAPSAAGARPHCTVRMLFSE